MESANNEKLTRESRYEVECLRWELFSSFNASKKKFFEGRSYGLVILTCFFVVSQAKSFVYEKFTNGSEFCFVFSKKSSFVSNVRREFHQIKSSNFEICGLLDLEGNKHRIQILRCAVNDLMT